VVLQLKELLPSRAARPTAGVRSETIDQDHRGSRPKDDVVRATTTTIAARIGSDTGTSLALAACAQLVLVQGKESFTRREILAEMRTATAYFKRTYSNNFSSYLSTLIGDGTVNERSPSVYTLSASSRDEVLLKLREE
jgi:hypothetical protein